MATYKKDERFSKRIATLRETTWLAQQIEWFEELCSTNDYVRSQLADLPHGALVGANQQTAGRGTHGRRWASDSSDDLYFSLVLREHIELDTLPLLALKAALAVVETLRGLEIRAEIKWPNDVLVADKKVSGILIETTVQGVDLVSVIVGVGINVGRMQFAGDFELEPTSVSLETKGKQDRAQILAQFLCHFETLLLESPEAIIERAEQCLAWRGARVAVDGAEGRLIGLASNGALRLRTQAAERTFSAGRLRCLSV